MLVSFISILSVCWINQEHSFLKISKSVFFIFFNLYFLFNSQFCVSFSTALSAVAPNGWRLGVRAGERKSSDGRQTFKFPQNFLRADTPTDAKPFVRCLRGRFALHLIKRTFHFARYEFSLIFYAQFSRFVEVFASAEISAKVSNYICFLLSNFPISLSFMQPFQISHFSRNSRKKISRKPQKNEKSESSAENSAVLSMFCLLSVDR